MLVIKKNVLYKLFSVNNRTVLNVLKGEIRLAEFLRSNWQKEVAL